MNDAQSLIFEEADEHWEQLVHEAFVPALKQENQVHHIAEGEYDGMSNREKGFFEAGVLRGLELAAEAVDEDSE